MAVSVTATTPLTLDKFIMIGSIIFLSGTIGIITFATSREMLLAGQFLSGLPWGTLNVIAPGYALEVSWC